jgi:hypothetical protein
MTGTALDWSAIRRLNGGSGRGTEGPIAPFARLEISAASRISDSRERKAYGFEPYLH